MSIRSEFAAATDKVRAEIKDGEGAHLRYLLDEVERHVALLFGADEAAKEPTPEPEPEAPAAPSVVAEAQTANASASAPAPA